MAPSERFDSPRLCFNSQDDAFDFARKMVEDSRRRAREGRFTCSDDYLKGRAIICLHVTAPPNTGDLKLIVKIVPSINSQSEWACSEEPFGVQVSTIAAERYSQDALMFVRPGEGGKHIELPVPSIMRLERLNERDEIGIDVFTAGLDFAAKVISRSAEGEMDALRVGPPKLDGAVAERLIKRMTQVIYDVVGKDAKPPRDSLFEAKLYDLLSGLRICVIDDVISASLDEERASRFKLGDAFFCPMDE